MGNIPPLKFVEGPKNQRRTGNMYKALDPDGSVAVSMDVGVLTEEDLLDIGINDRRAVIHL